MLRDEPKRRLRRRPKTPRRGGFLHAKICARLKRRLNRTKTRKSVLAVRSFRYATNSPNRPHTPGEPGTLGEIQEASQQFSFTGQHLNYYHLVTCPQSRNKFSVLLVASDSATSSSYPFPYIKQSATSTLSLLPANSDQSQISHRSIQGFIS